MPKKLRIGIIGNNADGTYRFRKELIEYFVSKGHEVIVYIPYEQNYISEIRSLMSISTRVSFIPLKRVSMNPISDLVLFLRLIIEFNHDKPDVVISYTIKPIIFGSIAAYLNRVSNIFSVITGLGYTFHKESIKQIVIGFIVRLLYRISLRFCKKVLFYNEDDLTLFLKNKLCKKDNSFVVDGHGVDIQEFNIDSSKIDLINYSINSENGDVKFLMAGRFLIEKGIIEYLNACRYLSQKYKNAEFYLAGKSDDNYSSLSTSFVFKLAKECNVKIIGWVDMKEILAIIDVFVLPSYGEGMPRSILEAMAMRKPIITTNSPGCRSTVKNGYNGFIVPIKNVGKLTIAMERFILDPGLINEMGAASRKLAEEKFDSKKIVRQIARIFDII